jgi:hypothetical protein
MEKRKIRSQCSIDAGLRLPFEVAIVCSSLIMVIKHLQEIIHSIVLGVISDIDRNNSSLSKPVSVRIDGELYSSLKRSHRPVLLRRPEIDH